MNYDVFVATIRTREAKRYKFDAENNPIMTDTKTEKSTSETLVLNYERATPSILICKP